METILYEYKAGIRYDYTMNLIVGVGVSGFFFYGAAQAVLNPRHEADAYLGVGILVLVPISLLSFHLLRRPRSFRLIRKDDGLFIRWNSGSELRLKSTESELKTFGINQVPYGSCIVHTDTRRGKLRLNFHTPGEAYDFSDVLSRQKNRR